MAIGIHNGELCNGRERFYGAKFFIFDSRKSPWKPFRFLCRLMNFYPPVNGSFVSAAHSSPFSSDNEHTVGMFARCCVQFGDGSSGEWNDVAVGVAIRLRLCLVSRLLQANFVIGFRGFRTRFVFLKSLFEIYLIVLYCCKYLEMTLKINET